MKNVWQRRLCLLLACLLALATLTACGNKDGEDGTGTESETEFDPNSLPRFDYLGKDVLSWVTLDPSMYTDMKLTIPSDLQVTDEIVDKTIASMQFKQRVPEDEIISEDESTSESVAEGAAESAVAAVADSSESESESESETAVKMTDEPMERGDSAFIYYRGEINGEEFAGGSNWSSNVPFELALGSGAFIDGFEDGLIGVVPSQTSRDNPYALKVTFPEDYDNEELNGKEAVFYVCVEYAVEYTIPELNFDLIWDVFGYKEETDKEKEDYADEAELIAEFRAYVRTTLEKNLEKDIEEAKVQALWYYLIDKVECNNYPEEEMAYYKTLNKYNMEQAYEYYCGIGGESFTANYPTLEDFAVAYWGLEDGMTFDEASEKDAKNIVARDVIVHAIAELEGLETVTDEEVESEIQYCIDYYKQNGNITKTRDEVIEEYGGENNIRMVALKVKMEEWLLERCIFTFED